jgi:hypothetical protein
VAASRGETAASSSPTAPGDLMDIMTFTTGVQETFAESRAAARRVQLSRCATPFATGLCTQGEHPWVVQSPAGHSSTVQTMETYFHLLEGIGGDSVDGSSGRPIADGLE